MNNLSQSLHLGLLPGLGSGLKTTAAGGQMSRFLTYYLQPYMQTFSQIAYFSYHQENLSDYTDNPDVQNQVTLYPKPTSIHYRRYALQMVQQYARPFQSCHVLRVFHTPGAIPAMQAKRRFGIPFVTTYGYKYHRFAALEGHRITGFLLRFLEPLVLRQATAVIVTTRELQTYVQRRTAAQQVYLIPNGVDTAVFKPAPPQNHTPQKPTILFVGRLNPQKNLFQLLDAVAQVQAPCHLRIVGDGPLRKPLAEKAQSLTISYQFDDTVPHHELPAIFQSADLFVLPSLIEGHPKVLLEAMSCGLPCIVSDSEGNRTLIQHNQNGLLAQRGNGRQLAPHIDQLLTSPKLAAHLGQAARQHILAHYDIHQLIQQEITLLRSLAKQ